MAHTGLCRLPDVVLQGGVRRLGQVIFWTISAMTR